MRGSKVVRRLGMLLVVASALGLGTGAGAFRKVSPGDPAPDFTAPTVDGQTVSLGTLKGKAVVLSFLRLGQEKSVKAARALQEVAAAFPERVRVVAVVVNPEEGDPKAWVGGLGIAYPVAVDLRRDVYGTYGVLVAPSTGVIDPEGRFVGEIGGYTSAFRDELTRLVRRALGEEVQEARVQTPGEEKRPERKLAERHLQKARVLLKRRMKKKALEAAREAVEADPSYGEAHELLGTLLLDMSEDNAGEAEAQFRKALEANPRSTGAQVGLARVLSIRGEHEKAVEALEKAARLSPRPERIYYEIGRVYERAGDYEKAVGAYRKALERLLR